MVQRETSNNTTTGVTSRWQRAAYVRMTSIMWPVTVHITYPVYGCQCDTSTPCPSPTEPTHSSPLFLQLRKKFEQRFSHFIQIILSLWKDRTTWVHLAVSTALYRLPPHPPPTHPTFSLWCSASRSSCCPRECQPCFNDLQHEMHTIGILAHFA